MSTERSHIPPPGTVLRAAFDKGHARLCGPECPAECELWEAVVRLDEMAVR